MEQKLRALGIDIAQQVFHLVGMDALSMCWSSGRPKMPR